MDLTKQSGEDIFELLIASDELLLEELSNHIQDHLLEKHVDWIQQNFVLVIHTVFKFADCKKLRDHCLESICSDPRSIIPSLENGLLLDLLQGDDLRIDEIEIWNCLIQWGIERTP